MKYTDYMEAARSVDSIEEAEELIRTVADDETISARQYWNIRHVALNTAYGF